MRAHDHSFTGLLVIEGLDQAAVRAAVEQLVTTVPAVGVADSVPLYAYLFGLDGRQLR